ncbi:hypothetical protein BC833DRAFT_582073 [Globomyces pollinis-pini]|nr:hypothetical protein BC833DRAFT_582073 [Globomyces pollinis-pini]
MHLVSDWNMTFFRIFQALGVSLYLIVLVERVIIFYPKLNILRYLTHFLNLIFTSANIAVLYFPYNISVIVTGIFHLFGAAVNYGSNWVLLRESLSAFPHQKFHPKFLVLYGLQAISILSILSATYTGSIKYDLIQDGQYLKFNCYAPIMPIRFVCEMLFQSSIETIFSPSFIQNSNNEKSEFQSRREIQQSALEVS